MNNQQQSAQHREKLEATSEKEAASGTSTVKNSLADKEASNTASNGDDSNKKSSSKEPPKPPVDPLQNDWRLFECHTWHLEPTVRLISWAGSQIEPYGIDYILQRLGFNHARTTIPKWVQRGCMDPLDKILSVIVLKTIQVVKEERQGDDHKKDREHPRVGGGGPPGGGTHPLNPRA